MSNANDAPVAVEHINWVERFAKSVNTTPDEHDAIMAVVDFARHRLAAIASAPAGDGGVVERIIHAIDLNDDDTAPNDDYRQGVRDCVETIRVMYPALARPRAAVGERYTGQGFLTPSVGLDEDGMCNEHGRQGCRSCVDDLLAPLAEQAAAMPYRDGVIRIIAEAGKLNEGGHADWTVHAEAFADMILALQSPPAKVEGSEV